MPRSKCSVATLAFFASVALTAVLCHRSRLRATLPSSRPPGGVANLVPVGGSFELFGNGHTVEPAAVAACGNDCAACVEEMYSIVNVVELAWSVAASEGRVGWLDSRADVVAAASLANGAAAAGPAVVAQHRGRRQASAFRSRRAHAVTLSDDARLEAGRNLVLQTPHSTSSLTPRAVFVVVLVAALIAAGVALVCEARGPLLTRSAWRAILGGTAAASVTAAATSRWLFSRRRCAAALLLLLVCMGSASYRGAVELDTRWIPTSTWLVQATSICGAAAAARSFVGSTGHGGWMSSVAGEPTNLIFISPNLIFIIE